MQCVPGLLSEGLGMRMNCQNARGRGGAFAGGESQFTPPPFLYETLYVYLYCVCVVGLCAYIYSPHVCFGSLYLCVCVHCR